MDLGKIKVKLTKLITGEKYSLLIWRTYRNRHKFMYWLSFDTTFTNKEQTTDKRKIKSKHKPHKKE